MCVFDLPQSLRCVNNCCYIGTAFIALALTMRKRVSIQIAGNAVALHCVEAHRQSQMLTPV